MKEPLFSDLHWSAHVLIIIVLGCPTFFLEYGWFAFGWPFIITLLFLVNFYKNKYTELKKSKIE